MKPNILSRRSVLVGFGGFILGGATAGFVGVKFRNELRSLLGASRPSVAQLGAVAGSDDGWLLTEEDRSELNLEASRSNDSN